MTRTRSSGQPEDQGQLVAVHVRRLGGDEDLDAPVDHAGRPGLGLDVRVLDPGRLEASPSPSRRPPASSRVDVAEPDEALDEHVARATPRGAVAPPGRAPHRSRAAAAAAPTRSAARRPRSRPRSRRRRRAPAPPRPGSARSPRRAPAGPCRWRRSRTGCCRGRRRRRGRGRGPDGAASTGPRSPTRNRAWACGDRTARRLQAPSAGRSSPNRSAAGHLGEAVGPGDARAHGAAGGRDRRLGDRSPRRPTGPRRRSPCSPCTGRARRRGRRGPRASSGSGSGPGGRRPPSASPACRRRTGRRHRRGTRPAGATARPRRRGPRPSSTRRPSTWPAATRQAQTCSPSSRTVHEPQSPALQPTFVPVRPRSSRSTSTRRRRPSVRTSTSRPLTANRERGLGGHAATSAIARRTSVSAASRR